MRGVRKLAVIATGRAGPPPPRNVRHHRGASHHIAPSAMPPDVERRRLGVGVPRVPHVAGEPIPCLPDNDVASTLTDRAITASRRRASVLSPALEAAKGGGCLATFGFQVEASWQRLYRNLQRAAEKQEGPQLSMRALLVVLHRGVATVMARRPACQPSPRRARP